jgi:hypothetical protein
MTASPTHSASALAWFSVLAPPLAWAAQLAIGYSLQEAGCGRPDSDLWGLGLDGLTAAVIIACALLACLGGLAGVAAFRSARVSDPLGRVEFMAVAGIAAGFIFLVAIALSGIALVPLDPCNGG